MRIKILGAGWYGCHIATELIADGHEVEIHETRSAIMQGASGNIPARLHLGFHYPRSHKTRAACRVHNADFMARYSFLTHGVETNIYAIAAHDSYVDFDQYCATLKGEVEFVKITDPSEYGLRHVEGAILTGERHILTDFARAHFWGNLKNHIRLGLQSNDTPDGFDIVIDCTFCSGDAAGVDRYEPCLVLMLKGRTDRAVTIMDGPFPSLYPWDEASGLCSLSSALWTPFSKECRTYVEAAELLASLSEGDMRRQAACMIDQMAGYYPEVKNYRLDMMRTSIRAMPRSGADTRLCDVRHDGDKIIRVRAGKIDAVIAAARMVKDLIGS